MTFKKISSCLEFLKKNYKKNDGSECKNEKIKNFGIEISTLCNAKCVFCTHDATSSGNKKYQFLSGEEFNEIFSSLKSIAGGSHVNVTFSGIGEPLTHPRWDKYLETALKCEQVQSVTLASNGILLNKENISKLLSLPNFNKVVFWFSLGGQTKKEYKELFGVDKLDSVVINVSNFLKKLNECGCQNKVILHAYNAKHHTLTAEKVREMYNFCAYEFCDYDICDKFNKYEGAKAPDYLKYYKDGESYYTGEILEDRTTPCALTKGTYFWANGNISACECGRPEESLNLLLGTMTDTVAIIEERRKDWRERWLKGNVPDYCRKCPIYVKET